jgi:NAD(P)-dependent dehydrogenase (short-subunit alcohol dehydrogenase family)
MPDLSGRTAIVTGASRGIGFGIARELLRLGCRVTICGRSQDTINAARDRLKMPVDRVLAITADVGVEADVQHLFQETRARFGDPAILVNNAGAFDGGPLESLSLSNWNNVLTACLTGTFLCTREAFRVMKPLGRGRILNIGSISAQVPREYSTPYTAAKFGVQGFTRAAALEGRRHGIVVSCLHPGNVRVERRIDSGLESDVEPMMDVDTIAQAAVAMLTMPDDVNFLDAIVLPNEQLYVGRG